MALTDNLKVTRLDGKVDNVTVGQVLASVPTYLDQIKALLAKSVLDETVTHPLTQKPVSVRAILTSLPAEHAKTRAAFEQGLTEAVKGIPGVTAEQIAEGVRRGIASIETTLTIKG